MRFVSLLFVLMLLAFDAGAIDIPNFISGSDPSAVAESAGAKIFNFLAFVVLIAAAIAGLVSTWHMIWGESAKGWMMLKGIIIGLVVLVSIGGIINFVVV